jgi:hypothetical protein
MNRFARPIMFALEPDLVFLSARLTFGASGAVTLDTKNSKGFCAATLNTIAFTGTTANSSPTISSVSSFAGLYPGMTVQDSGPTHVNSTISSMSTGGDTITLAANATGTNTGLTAFGGQYVLQFGRTAGVNLDTYNKLLFMDSSWDESGSQGSASALALAPAGPISFIVGNNISIRTIPSTSTSVNTDATVTVQFGSGQGTSFTAYAPASGEAVRLFFVLCRSGAI